MPPSVGAPSAAGFAPVRAWAVTLFLTLCYSISLVDRFILAFVAEPLRADLGMSDTQLGLVQGFAFSIIYAVAGLPLGAAVDRFQRTRIVSAAIAVWSVMTAMCGLAANFIHLLLARIGVGAGEAGLTPAAYSLLGDLFPRERLPLASMMYMLAPTIATASAAWLSGLLLSAAGEDGMFLLPHFGGVAAWRIVLFAVGVPGLVIAMVALSLREPARRTAVVSRRAEGELIAFLRKHWRLHVVFMLGGMFSVLVGYAANAWTPSVLSRQFHWTPAETGAALGGVMLVCGLVGTLAGGALCSWGVTLGRDYIIVISAALAMTLEVVAGAALFFVGTGEQFIMIASILFIASPMLFMIGPTLMQLVTPAELRGRMTALTLFVSIALGAGGGPLAVGAANEVFWSGQGLMQALGLVLIVAGTAGAILSSSCVLPMRAYLRGQDA